MFATAKRQREDSIPLTNKEARIDCLPRDVENLVLEYVYIKGVLRRNRSGELGPNTSRIADFRSVCKRWNEWMFARAVELHVVIPNGADFVDFVYAQQATQVCSTYMVGSDSIKVNSLTTSLAVRSRFALKGGCAATGAFSVENESFQLAISYIDRVGNIKVIGDGAIRIVKYRRDDLVYVRVGDDPDECFCAAVTVTADRDSDGDGAEPLVFSGTLHDYMFPLTASQVSRLLKRNGGIINKERKIYVVPQGPAIRTDAAPMVSLMVTNTKARSDSAVTFGTSFRYLTDRVCRRGSMSPDGAPQVDRRFDRWGLEILRVFDWDRNPPTSVVLGLSQDVPLLLLIENGSFTVKYMHSCKLEESETES